MRVRDGFKKVILEVEVFGAGRREALGVWSGLIVDNGNMSPHYDIAYTVCTSRRPVRETVRTVDQTRSVMIVPITLAATGWLIQRITSRAPSNVTILQRSQPPIHICITMLGATGKDETKLGQFQSHVYVESLQRFNRSEMKVLMYALWL